MTREILFRGKRLDNGEWVEGLLFKYCGEFCIALYSLEGDDYGLYPTCYAKVDPSTVGQFTGLYDKNGVRIFEGDVLCVIGQGIFKCRWDDGNFEFCLSGKESFGLAYVSPNDIFVTGNIHDNPELLEVEG